MYCNKCGNKLVGNEKYCPNCGNMIDVKIQEVGIVDNHKSTEGKRTASIILGGISLGGVFLGIFAPISLILSIIGLILAIGASKNGRNTAGIVLNAISLFLSLIITCVIALIIWFIVNTSTDIGHSIWESYYDNYYDEYDSDSYDDF